MTDPLINHDDWDKEIMTTTGDRIWVLWGGIFKDTTFRELDEGEELHGPYHTEAEADRMWKEIMRRNVDRATHRVFVIEVPKPQAVVTEWYHPYVPLTITGVRDAPS